MILVLLLTFILENTQRVDISYFGVHGHLPGTGATPRLA